MKKPYILLILFLSLVASGAYDACAGRQPLSLEACIDSAVAHNPALNAAALEVRKTRILKATAFNPPMTEITLKQETTGGGGPENGVYFGQEFEFPSVYVARHRSLGARADLAGSRLDVMLADTEKEITAAYYEILYSRELMRLNRCLDTIYGEFCRVAAVRVEQGDAGALELMNARRVKEENELAYGDLLLRYESLCRELKRLTGCESEPEPEDEALTCITDAYVVADYDFRQTARGLAAERELRVAEREVALARNEFLPGIRVGATVQALIRSFNPYHVERLPFDKGNFMGFEVGITVPLFFGAGSARLKAAQADREISRLNMEAADAQGRGEADRLTTILRTLTQRLDYYKSVSLPRADEICRIAGVSYELGDITYLEYISNVETAYGVYREHAACINDYNQTVISLKSLFK